MRKIIVGIAILTILFGCNRIKYGELFEITDEFVENLHTKYESYGLFGGLDYTKHTKDNEYQVVPMGRMICVKIEHVADDDEYESLRRALESHYSDDSRVKSVYRNQGGTLMIDCRN
ncbi:MAG: ABC transporter [Prevotella sp.]|nr:ABC transporter [Prevotella sp.]